MNTQAFESSGLRRAALTLHALGHDDRDWLLQRLHAPQRQVLRTLLAELKALSIPPDQRVINAALDAATPGASPRPPGEALALCRALEKEPLALQELALASMPAPQRADVMAHWLGPRPPLPSAVSLERTPRLSEALLASWLEAAQGDVA